MWIRQTQLLDMGMKNWQFFILIAVLFLLITKVDDVIGRLQYVQEILEEQWTIMDSSAYKQIDRYKDMPEEELFEGERF